MPRWELRCPKHAKALRSCRKCREITLHYLVLAVAVQQANESRAYRRAWQSLDYQTRDEWRLACDPDYLGPAPLLQSSLSGKWRKWGDRRVYLT